MSYTITTEEMAPRLVAGTRVHTTLTSVGNAIGAGFAQIMPALGEAGIAPTGPPMVVYHDVLDAETDGEIEVCIPVGASLPEGASEVYTRELEGGTVAATVHHGPYGEAAPAYERLGGWTAENNHEVVGPPREIYLNDPEMVPPEELQTRIEFPIRYATT